MPNKITLLMYESWAEMDRAIAGITPVEATTRHRVGSSIAWTVGHVTHWVDTWINGKFQGLPPHPVISDPGFRAGGSGDADDWSGILAAVHEVRRSARRFLDSEPEPDIERVVPYDGSIAFLRPTGLSLRYALMRTAAHHFIHVGEVMTIRSSLGHTMEAVPEWGRLLV